MTRQSNTPGQLSTDTRWRPRKSSSDCRRDHRCYEDTIAALAIYCPVNRIVYILDQAIGSELPKSNQTRQSYIQISREQYRDREGAFRGAPRGGAAVAPRRPILFALHAMNDVIFASRHPADRKNAASGRYMERFFGVKNRAAPALRATKHSKK